MAAADVREVVSYEGLYRDVVDDGEEIEARGKLERVGSENENGDALQYYRLVIGTTMLEGEGYIKLSRRGEGLD